MGTLDGPVEETFGSVASVAAGPDLSAYVADAQVQVVRHFDADGVYVGGIGREGDGPGEFTWIWSVATTAEDQLLVWDATAYRMHEFRLDGRFVRTFPTPMLGLVGGPTASMVPQTDGTLLLRTSAGVPGPIAGGGQEAVYAWLRFSPDGEFLDSIVPPRRRVAGFTAAFKLETVSTPSPAGYFVSGRNDRYAIHRPLADGRVVRIEGDPEPVPVHDQEASEWRAYAVAYDQRMALESPEVPTHKPVWKSLAVDGDGRIWVERYVEALRDPVHARRMTEGPAVEWVEPSTWDVIDPRGAYLGTIVVPVRSRFGEARGDHAWFIVRGDFDEEYVVRYRVDGLTGG